MASELYRSPYFRIFGSSLVLHILGLVLLLRMPAELPKEARKIVVKLKVPPPPPRPKIVKKKVEEPKVKKEEKKVEKKPKKKLVKKKKVPKKVAKTIRKVSPKQPTQKRPISGLSKSSFAKGSGSGSGFTAPVGNTLMTEDIGIREEEVLPLDPDVDLSREAELLEFKKPEYSDEAFDVGLEGRFQLELLVDASGMVQKAELPRPVGYGMDERLLKAAYGAKYRPRTDRNGKAISGWKVEWISLTIED